MDRLRVHPLIAIIVGALLLSFLALFLIERAQPATVTQQPRAWDAIGGGAGQHTSSDATQKPPSSDTPAPTEPQPDMNELLSPTSSVRVPFIPVRTPDPVEEVTTGAAANLQALLMQITRDRRTPPVENATSATPYITQAFSFLKDIPLDVTAPSPRSAEQEELYRYGNAVGTLIRSFEQAHPDSVGTLAGHAQDRRSTSRQASVEALGAAYRSLADSILAVTNVPITIATDHDRLAEAYRRVGNGLSDIAKSTDDKAFLAAITAYNTSAEEHMRAYIALSTTLSVNGISFEPSDGGSVFMFNRN